MSAGNSSHTRSQSQPATNAGPDGSVGSSNSRIGSRKGPPASAGSPAIGSSSGTQPAASIGSTLPENFDTDRTVISKDVPVAVPLSMAHLPPAEMGKVLQGRRLGHYELLEFVGGGGMGAVFRALDTMLDRIVAVKVLSKVQSNDDETLRRFKNEAQSAARLDHENIGRVHYVGEDQGWHYIVFEFIEGINLRDLVDRDGPLTLADAVSFTLQVADALAHAAQRDVVHRDIKPSNVLITPSRRAKLVDMGLARLHQVEHSGNDLTASGVTLGTFDYISPEQARDPRNADVRSDIYSLGCTLYFMVTGRPPFPEGTVLQKLLQHQADEPTDPRSLRPDLPEELLKIIRRMLVKAPAQRYQLPEMLIRDLVAMSLKYGLPTPATSLTNLTPAVALRPPLFVRQLPWLAPLAVLLLIALVMAIGGRLSDADVRPPPIHHSAATKAADSASRSEGNRDIGVSKVEGVNSTNSRSTEGASAIDPTARSTAASGTNTAATPVNAASVASKSQPSEVQDGPKSEKPSVGQDSGKLPGSSADFADGGSSPRLSTPLVLLDAARVQATSRFDPEHSIQQRLQQWTGVGSDRIATAAVRAPWLPDTAPPNVAAPGANRATPAVTASDPFAAPAPERKGLLIVSRAHEGPNEYASVVEACRAAKSGEVIELRYSGRLDSRPIKLTDQRLTIRAGDGYAPVVNFRPRESDLAQSHSMISLGGSQLTLINLQLEFDLPRDIVAENLSLGEIRPGESIRLDGCALTIGNASDAGTAYHPDVAFFEIRAVPGPGVMVSKDTPMVRPAASLQLKNCIVRGEALFVRANELQPVSIAWENGLLATTERFFGAIGGPSDPKPQGQAQIELRHVTAVMQGGFVQLTATEDTPLELPLEVSASDCIFVGKPGAPFIDQSGVDEPEDMRKHIAWNGDRNFYEGVDLFWRLGGPGGGDSAVQMMLADWQGFWGAREIQPSVDQVVWQKLPAAERPVHLQLPADYALHGGENPAHNAASDGRDAGFQADLLPIIKE